MELLNSVIKLGVFCFLFVIGIYLIPLSKKCQDFPE